MYPEPAQYPQPATYPQPAHPRPRYPDAPRLDLVDELHGQAVADPYRWLEDPADARTAAWSAGQDTFLAAERQGWPDRPRWRAELADLLGAGDVSAPAWRGSRPFFWRRDGGQEHGTVITVDPDGTHRVLVDPMAVDPSANTTLDAWSVSPDGSLIAYLLSSGGTERSAMWIKDVGTEELVDGPIDRMRYSPIAWLASGRAIYVVRHLPDAPLERRVYLHQIGTDADGDRIVFGHDAPPGLFFDVTVSADGRWLWIGASQGTDPRNEVWLADLTAGAQDTPDLRPLQQGVDAWVDVDVRASAPDRLLVLTDRDAARKRICVVPTDDLSYGSWRELVPADPEAVIEDFVVLDGEELDRPALLVTRSRHAVSELALHDLATGEWLADVALPGLGTVWAPRVRPVGGHEAWFMYTDFTTPATVYRFDAVTRTLDVWAAPPGSRTAEARMPEAGIPVAGAAADGGAAGAGLVTRQVVVTSADGTPVRMFVISGDGASGGPVPTILSGYGGFRISLTPAYSAMIVAWVRAGGVYAIANLRGGGEEGEQWHRAGMLAHKQRVFDDFHAAALWLVNSEVTTHAQLGIVGGSNGGLLVGAALTQHPACYAAVVCSAPLLDMVRSELFGLGTLWTGEYGSVADPDQFAWLLAYSPYHNVHEGVDYPAVLFTVFDGDTRVDPLHARKMAAALQHATTATRPILLRRESDVGHGARAVSRTVELIADELAFLAHELGHELGHDEGNDEGPDEGPDDGQAAIA